LGGGFAAAQKTRKKHPLSPASGGKGAGGIILFLERPISQKNLICRLIS